MNIDEARKLSNEAVAASGNATSDARRQARHFTGSEGFTAALVLMARGERPRESSVKTLGDKLIDAATTIAASNRRRWREPSTRRANMPGSTERGEDAAG